MYPLCIDGSPLGWVHRLRAVRLAAFDDVFRLKDEEIQFLPHLADALARTDALDHIARTLAAENALTAWRDERYAIAPDLGAPPWFLLERAAARYFGVHTWAAHANGLVRADDGVRMWLARRSRTKSIDPGMLDNLVGGGIAEGAGVTDTLVKEAWEEAGVPAALGGAAQFAGAVDIRRDQPDGLQWETVFVHDLWLPADFVPANQDDEAFDHRLVTLDGAARLIALKDHPDEVTTDASLVILDCLRRHGVIAAGDAP